MASRWLFAIVMLLSFTLFTVGCGVAQEKYDALSANLSELREKYDAQSVDLGKIQQELLSSKGELDKSQTELKTVQSELAKAKDSLQVAQGNLSKIDSLVTTMTPKLDLVQRFLTAESTGRLSTQARREGKEDEAKKLDALVVSIFQTFDPLVDNIHDGELSRSWGETWPTGARQQSESQQRAAFVYVGMSKFLSRLVILIKTDSDALQAAFEKADSQYSVSVMRALSLRYSTGE